jgi:hypothetical protein
VPHVRTSVHEEWVPLIVLSWINWVRDDLFSPSILDNRWNLRNFQSDSGLSLAERNEVWQHFGCRHLRLPYCSRLVR